MFKNFENKDIFNLQSFAKEYCALYPSGTVSQNIKTFSHWTSGSVSGSYYHAIYNTYPSSSNAIELADLTFGFSKKSVYFLSSSSSINNLNEKLKIYRYFAQKLLGTVGSIFKINNQEKNELIFLCFNRSQFKDKIEPASVTVVTPNTSNKTLVFNDAISQTIKKSFGGEYNELYSGSIINVAGTIISSASFSGKDGRAGGLVFYDAGIIILDPDVIGTNSVNIKWSGSYNYAELVSGSASATYSSTFDNLLFGIRTQITGVFYNSIMKIKNTVYECYGNKEEFNYSSNPTFIKPNGEIITNSSSMTAGPQTYITKIGLYDKNRSLLAIASTSQPLRKNKNTDLIIRVKLDY